MAATGLGLAAALVWLPIPAVVVAALLSAVAVAFIAPDDDDPVSEPGPQPVAPPRRRPPLPAEPTCSHPHKAPVDLKQTGQVIGWLCLDCPETCVYSTWLAHGLGQRD